MGAQRLSRDRHRNKVPESNRRRAARRTRGRRVSARGTTYDQRALGEVALRALDCWPPLDSAAVDPAVAWPPVDLGRPPSGTAATGTGPPSTGRDRSVAMSGAALELPWGQTVRAADRWSASPCLGNCQAHELSPGSRA